MLDPVVCGVGCVFVLTVVLGLFVFDEFFGDKPRPLSYRDRPSKKTPDNSCDFVRYPDGANSVHKRNLTRKSSDKNSKPPRYKQLCQICDEEANVLSEPCGHFQFCDEHVEMYMLTAEEKGILLRCPDCRKEISRFVLP